MNLRTLQSVLIFYCCILLAGCTSAPRLDDGAIDQAAANCAGANQIADDRRLASAEQLRLLKEGKAQYRNGDYALAEASFRKATEITSFGKSGRSRVADLESWFGLAASYDQLKRFDLADQVYEHIRAEYPPSVAYYNNYGYSLELRGDKKGAQEQYKMATGLAPACEISHNNLAFSKGG